MSLFHALLANGQGGEGEEEPTYSTTAQAVFDLMTGLTVDQKNAMAAFIDSQVTSGNWALLDVFQFYALGTTNGLKGWKGAYNGSNPNAYSFVTGGVDLNASGNGILTGFTPTTGVKWQARDAVEMAYVYRNDSTEDQNCLIGGGAAYAVQRTSSNRLDFNVNGVIRQITSYPTGWEVGLWSAKLEQFDVSTEQLRVYKNGTDLGVGSSGTATERASEVRVGGRAGDTTPTFDGVISLYAAGAGDGFDVPNFYTNLATMMTSLGL